MCAHVCVWVVCETEREKLHSRLSEVSKFPTNAHASDTGVVHLPITKAVWTPVSPLPPTSFSPLGHPLCPPSRPGKPHAASELCLEER